MFSGDGFQGDNGMLSTDPGRLVVDMPAFRAETEFGDAFVRSCGGHFAFGNGIPGYRLAIKSVSYEGYLYSSGGMNIRILLV
jgi:hypothetical protein